MKEGNHRCRRAWKANSCKEIYCNPSCPLAFVLTGYRNFKRYCATVPLGMHPPSCGGHQHPPSRSRGLPAAGQPCCSWQATGPRHRARPGRVAGDGQPARLGLGTYYKSSCNAGGAAAGSCWVLAGNKKRVQKLVGLDHSIDHPSWPVLSHILMCRQIGRVIPSW